MRVRERHESVIYPDAGCENRRYDGLPTTRNDAAILLQMYSDGYHKPHGHLTPPDFTGRPAGHFGKNGGYDWLKTPTGRFEDFPVAALAQRIHHELHGDDAMRTVTVLGPPDILG